MTERIDKRRTCSSCLIRIRFAEPSIGSWTKIEMSPLSFKHLRLAAVEWDVLTAKSEEPVTAVDFIDWLAPSIPGSVRYVGHEIPEMEGQSVVEHGFKTGTMATRHGQPDPLPFLDRRRVA